MGDCECRADTLSIAQSVAELHKPPRHGKATECAAPGRLMFQSLRHLKYRDTYYPQNTLSVPYCHATRKKPEDWDTVRLPKSRQGNPEAEVGSEPRIFQSLSSVSFSCSIFRCLTAMPPDGCTRAGILLDCASLDRGSREAEVGFEPRTFRLYLYQLSSAIAYCHQNDVIHRDLKPDNILLGSRGETKIADFGSAVHRPASRFDPHVIRSRRRTAPFGTLDYLAPEVIDPESSYENSVDTWSLGVLTYEMLVGQVPFVGETPQDVANQILSCEPQLPGEFDADAVDLISSVNGFSTAFRCHGVVLYNVEAIEVICAVPNLVCGGRPHARLDDARRCAACTIYIWLASSMPLIYRVRWPECLEREFTNRKVRGSNPTSASRFPLSRLGQPGSIPALVLPSGSVAVGHQKGATAEGLNDLWYTGRTNAIGPEERQSCHSDSSLPLLYRVRWLECLEREFIDRKICGSNPTSVSRLPLSRLGQPGNIPALVPPSCGMAARYRMNMLQKRPELRIPLTGIHSHPWMRQHAEFSLTRCTAALLDWESPNLKSTLDNRSDYVNRRGARWPKWLEREFTDRKVRGSNPTSAFRLLLSRLTQPGSIQALVQPSGGMAVGH
ncbi:hypothetical protein T265_06096 [Opisthorchis viverrini]|uniref:Protein kinase domain-containing protein n=1 Tax=Opisthorchis viverrini TaxID=6198 RepID=A0A075AEH9_OPIVI|nr:hypothetical protein T265_06096 [Opisthorchis viverrini]KER26734.1 hypothetical protein T265_06096 [Opisthorchis viverrini]